MILAINYANEKYKSAQRLNSRWAKIFGADKVIEYSPDDLSDEFKEKNHDILKYERGIGYWIWKPYIIKDALSKVRWGDYVVYTDSGSVFIRPLKHLIRAMDREHADIMVFCINQIERKWAKRDALVLMDCDKDEFLDSLQICGGYIIVKKTAETCKFIDEYLYYAQDKRIVTDEPNVMGKDNYSEFVENRHDQTILSLLCKKHGIQPFRDPSQYGLYLDIFPKEVRDRSTYKQVIDSHRNPNITSIFSLVYMKMMNMMISTVRKVKHCWTR